MKLLNFSNALCRTFILALISLSLPACHRGGEEPHEEHHQIVATSPMAKDVIITQQYVCQIRSRRHINVHALVSGYLEDIPVREGQMVKKGDLMFKIVPILYQAKADAELAEAKLKQLELNYANKLYKENVISQNEVALHQAKLAKAQAQANLAQAELNFTNLRAPFDGIIDRLREQQGSLIKEKDILTTLSDNSVMWVYFNVPEARYLEYMEGQTDVDEFMKRFDKNADGLLDKAELPSGLAQTFDRFDNNNDAKLDRTEVKNLLSGGSQDPRIDLVLANGKKFKQSGKIGAIEAQFNNETGNIPFRADFPNPDGLLRHGQTGTILIYRTLRNALVIPQRATFEILDKRYVYVIDKDNVVHQRAIEIRDELEDIFVIRKGLDARDKIVFEGIRQVRDGEKVEYEFRPPEQVLANQKNHAE